MKKETQWSSRSFRKEVRCKPKLMLCNVGWSSEEPSTRYFCGVYVYYNTIRQQKRVCGDKKNFSEDQHDCLA